MGLKRTDSKETKGEKSTVKSQNQRGLTHRTDSKWSKGSQKEN